MSHLIYITLQGAVYYSTRRSENDDHVLRSLSECLFGVPEGHSFDVLYRGMSRDWKLQDDIPNPFGDSRARHVSAVWVIDPENDVLTLYKKDTPWRISLGEFRQGPVSLHDMKLLDSRPSPNLTLNKDFPTPTWQPKAKATERQIAFIGKLLEDFSYQWRHVFRSRYKDHTFRKLARAILRIVTIDFTVKEIASFRPKIRGPLVSVEDLPQWEPLHDRVINLERVSVVLCQHLSHAKAVIEKDFIQRRVRSGLRYLRNVVCNETTYVVLSVREVFLYRRCYCPQHAPTYTRPEPLFNGVESPSKRGLEYLLMAAAPGYSVSPLHKLPLEIQNLILREVSLGPVESARVGCVLSLGSAFGWRNESGALQLQESLTARAWHFPVESQVWFDGCPSGLAYV